MNIIYTKNDLDRHFENDPECYTVRQWLEYGIDCGFINDYTKEGIDNMSDETITALVEWVDYLEDK